MKLFCKCQPKITPQIDEVIDYLKQFDDEAIKNIVEAVKLSRKADAEKNKALESFAENWYAQALESEEFKKG